MWIFTDTVMYKFIIEIASYITIQFCVISVPLSAAWPPSADVQETETPYYAKLQNVRAI